MTPERVAALVGRWVRHYTRGLPQPLATRRIEEIQADMDDHITHARAEGTGERRLALGILSRMVRGLPADLAWRDDHASDTEDDPVTSGGRTVTDRTAYRSAVALAIGTVAFLAWGVLAMGVIGAEGDRFDLLYLAVPAVGIVGALAARWRPSGMVRTLLAMAGVQALITVVALIIGKQESPVSSVPEIVGLNGLFVALFLGAAWLFSRAGRRDRASQESDSA